MNRNFDNDNGRYIVMHSIYIKDDKNGKTEFITCITLTNTLFLFFLNTPLNSHKRYSTMTYDNMIAASFNQIAKQDFFISHK